MINIDKWIQESKCPVKMIMQVHDELVFEIQNNFVEEAKLKINKMRSGCFKLSVPLVVEIGVDQNWEKAHAGFVNNHSFMGNYLLTRAPI